MNVMPTPLNDLFLIEPKVFGDHRGFFIETYQEKRYQEMGLKATFVQDNRSRSQRGILRGLHFQMPQPQVKLVSVVRGEIWDVVVDVRRSSSTFGQWYGVYLNETNNWQLYVPEGFAHGFCVISEIADVTYKCSSLYAPANEKSLLWNDQDLNIPWPVENPTLSAKDLAGKRLCDLECFP